ncbi:MAG: FtsW/RodA/SpoVE family cell cycle protein [Lachnospiraceae bacterium]|nr:FtsW/RodA/SpoVE family cell cycle protein [Lachnospiraceae bacterium]
MSNMIVELSKYFMIIFIAFYTLHCFTVFRYANEEERNGFYIGQNILMFLIHFTGYVVLCFQTSDYSLIIFYGIQQIMLFAVILLYRVLYPESNRLIINNMCLLLSVSFIILTRLSYDKSIKQFKIVIISLIISLIIPYFVSKLRAIKKMTWIYGGVGLFALTAVMVLGSVTYGSKISFSLFGFTFQPSEFVKIIFVFFIAGMLTESTTIYQVIATTIMAGAHVVVLVLSKDLGSALIFFVVYVVMIYVGTKKPIYLLAGIGAGAGGAVLGYHLFSHVRTRVIAWRDPFQVIEGQGYQITQSLFAIGTGGWFGMGLYQGSPEKIPVVEADFIFSAISEEMGCLFSLCLILICISNYLMFMNIAMKMKDVFYRLIAVGLATIYGFQMFLTIGGVTKFIPLTGVTLPLVSYGGTSVITTLIMFSIIQGIYILRHEETVGVE